MNRPHEWAFKWIGFFWKNKRERMISRVITKIGSQKESMFSVFNFPIALSGSHLTRLNPKTKWWGCKVNSPLWACLCKLFYFLSNLQWFHVRARKAEGGECSSLNWECFWIVELLQMSNIAAGWMHLVNQRQVGRVCGCAAYRRTSTHSRRRVFFLPLCNNTQRINLITPIVCKQTETSWLIMQEDDSV